MPNGTRNPALSSCATTARHCAGAMEPSGLLPASRKMALRVTDVDLAIDPRRFDSTIAGPVALAVAKIIRISEWLGQSDRQSVRLRDRDALGAFRLLQAVDTSDRLVGRAKHKRGPNTATVADEAVEILHLHTSSPQCRIALLAASAAGGDATRAPAFVVRGDVMLAGPGMTRARLSNDPWMWAAYAEEQQNGSPHIPHGKVTAWLRPIKIPCQGPILTG